MKTEHVRKAFGAPWALCHFYAFTVCVQPVSAQVSELVVTDDAGGTQAFVSGISSLDFYDNGLYWTVFGGACSGEFTMHPSMAILGFRNKPFPLEHYVAMGCAQRAIGGAVRDDAFAFYTTPGGVMRKPVGAGPDDSGSLTGPFWNELTPGAMMVFNGRAYHALSHSSPLLGQDGPKGHFIISYFNLPGDLGSLEPVTEVSHGDGLPNVGRIKKMGVIFRRVQGGGPNDLSPFGLALTESGFLLRFFVDQTIPQFRAASIIASGATDFAVRREQFFDPDPLRLSYEEDQLYVSVGTSYCPNDPPSRIITLDPITFQSSTIYTSTDGYIAAIAADQGYLFASTFGRRELGGPFGGCELVGAGVIRSKCRPSSVFVACTEPPPDPNWDAIEPFFAGQNLRSDGRFLYFTRGKELRRIPNNSPATRHDFQALGFEVVQVIQDLNNSVRLVEGKRTVVRAYARVADTTLAQTDWFPNAQLRGWRDGVELPGPLYPRNNAKITATSDFNVLRPDASLSFQFELPTEWVRRGRLTLRFTVNPNLALYESGASPLGNNSGEQGNLQVVEVRPPCFVFASIHSDTAPNYWPWENASDFAKIMERAKSLLPVPDIHIHPTTERVSDEHVCIRTCDGPLDIPVPCGVICNDPFDLTQRADWKEALLELAVYDSFDQNRPGCSRTHYVGAIHPAAMNVAAGGIGETPGTHFIAFMADDTLLPENRPWAGRTVAHEFGHNLNRRHIDQRTSAIGCGGSRPENADPSYPFDTCTVGLTNLALAAAPMGFDVLNFKPIRPNNAGDLMSYATNRWPSIFTYNAMLNDLGPIGPEAFAAVAAAPPPGPYMLVRGILNLRAGMARVKGCYTLNEGVADPAKVQSSLDAAAAQAGHGYAIHKLDGNGGLLEQTPLVVKEIEDDEESTTIINQFITKPAGMAALQIVRGGVVLAECRATANTPVVTGVTAVYDAGGPALRINIRASDADTDPLLFSVQFSSDNGVTWRTLRVNEGSLSFTTNPRFLPGGANCRIRVIASDGFNSAVAMSDPFALPGRAPEPFIGGVLAGQRLPFGSTESLLGFALDAEDGSLPAASLNWSLVGLTPKTGTGAALPLHGLSPGNYTATLRTTDSHGNEGSTTVAFEILPLVVAESSAPVLDGDANDAAYASATPVSLPLSPKTTARFIHAAGNLYVAFTDLPYGGVSIPGRIGLYVDVDASGDTAVQPSDLAFYVSDDGTPEQYEGNGTEMVLRANPSSGFKAVISRGEGGWNAEFRIADSLVGGWNHAVRIGLFDQWATTIFIFGIPIDTPMSAGWPESMNPNNPATWATAWFGSVLPPPGNQPPVARAEAPRYADANGPTTVTLNGSASFDPESAPLNFAWTQLQGPSVTLENAASATPAFTAEVSSPTTFRFRLVVNDGHIDSAADELEVILTPVTPQLVQLPPSATRHEDGSVTVGLGWSGREGDQVVIQVSSDLVTWDDLTTATVSALQVVVFTDAQAGIHSQRFYRLANAPGGAPSSAGGTGLQFDGMNDYVEVPHASALNSLPLTVTAWVKTSQTTGSYPGIITKYHGDGLSGYAFGLDRGRLTCWYTIDSLSFIVDEGADSGMPFIADGQWHHIAFVVDAAGGHVYLDGSLARSTAWEGTPTAVTTSEPLRFGMYPGKTGMFYYGELDDVTLWNRALTKEEIGRQMGQSPTGTEAGLLGYWRFDERAGTVAIDASANGRNGTLHNAPARIESSAPIFLSPPFWTGLQFDGVDDSVQVATQPALNAFPLTVAFWLNTMETGFLARGLVSKYADNSGNGYSLLLSEGRVQAWYFRSWSDYVWDANLNSGFVADGEWHHIVLVVDSSGGRLYVDGTLKSSLPWVGSPGAVTTTEPLQFGRYFNYPVALNGQLDEIALWNRALTEAEINSLIPGRPGAVANGVIGYWSLDEGPGDTAADSSGHGRHGVLRNGPSRIISTAPVQPNAAAGTALRFDGVDDTVQVAHHAALNAFPLTIAGWLKTSQNSPGYVTVLNKYPSGAGNGYSLHIHNGRLAAFYFRGDGASYVYTADPGLDGGFIADGRWHHVAYVVDASGGRIYVDGTQTGSLGWTGTPGPCTTPVAVFIGPYPFSGQTLSLDGRIDELTLWNRPLDTAEINAVMNFKQTGTEPGLVGFWPFDNGTGATATDATGHGHNGVLQNGALWVPSDAPVYP